MAVITQPWVGAAFWLSSSIWHTHRCAATCAFVRLFRLTLREIPSRIHHFPVLAFVLCPHVLNPWFLGHSTITSLIPHAFSILATTFGNVRIPPEYHDASPQGARVAGRIDFFIPILKWGIEITRDGSRIPEHDARFADSGAYGALLKSADLNDYIHLDFRTKTLSGQHPSMILPFLTNARANFIPRNFKFVSCDVPEWVSRSSTMCMIIGWTW